MYLRAVNDGSQQAPEPAPIRVLGAAEHNLQGFDVDLPRQRWTAVVGPSGSGKTSLVFATIVAESQRRYLSTLSARARHLLGALGRPRVSALESLPVAIAVGSSTTVGNLRSTVGTLTGISDLLRLLFAREGVIPNAEPDALALSRSDFSFNHPRGACSACQGIGVADRVDPALLVADPNKTIRGGALVPTLDNGYTVYSQVTVDVMDQICHAHGFSVDTPWNELTAAQHEVIFFGSRKLEVPFGKHSLESRMRWKGITARPRQTGYYRGLIPVIEETLARSRNPGVLRFVRSTPCPECEGSRLGPRGRTARVGDATLPELSALPAHRLDERLKTLPRSSVWDALAPSVHGRLLRMQRLSLGHLALDRVSTTLSGGEAQRVRLAAQLGAALSGTLVALDEPTLGLAPQSGADMALVLDELVDEGNTLVVVEHDPDMVRHAEHLVAIGPHAGPRGGHLTYAGAPGEDPLGGPPAPKRDPRPGHGVLTLTGARLHNLDDASLRVKLGALNVVIGPSGAGKSSLVFGTLLPALTGAPGGPYERLDGAAAGKVRTLDARPPGRTPRSTPATYSGIWDLVRARFARTDSAKAKGMKAGHFSYNNKEGRCPACEGLGVQRVGLHLLADASIACPTCEGQRYAPAVLEVELSGRSVADLLAMSVAEAHAFFADDERIAALLSAMEDLGLGYLELGQSSASLSRGETQRLGLAGVLGRRATEPTMLLLDEPDRGLHPSDIEQLLGVLDRLVEAGHTIVAISHHRHLWAAADSLTEVRDGKARPIEHPPMERLSRPRARPRPPHEPALVLRDVRLHNLQGIDVTIPHDSFTAVIGPSGSGKSSLAFGTIVAEAWHRFAETLPFSARRHVRRLPRPNVGSIRGLRPVIALAQGQARAPGRSTVATASELSPLLRTLWSRAGRVEGEPCGLSAEHFSPDRPRGACSDCAGLGTVPRCDPQRLLSDPTKPVAGGAFAGTRPGAFFTEPDGQHMATLRVAAQGEDLDRPWSELPAALQSLVLDGAGDRTFAVRWTWKRGRRSGEHTFEGTWDGLCALVEREAVQRAGQKRATEWSEPLVDARCSTCGGTRLQPEVARVRVGEWTLPTLLEQPLSAVARALASVEPVDEAQGVVLDALRPEVAARLSQLVGLGLGHLSLDRATPTLSEGERQRVRLAGVLRDGLSETIVVLDEPAAGLHPGEIDTLVAELSRLRDQGNTVLVVAHRPELWARADHVIELGPGAGDAGGRIVHQGPPEPIALTPIVPSGATARAEAWIEIHGARAHNLAQLDLRLPASGFVAVTGVSGSGKSSLVFDVLHASAQAGRALGCRRIEGLSRFASVVSARQARRAAGAQTVATATSMLQPLGKLFAAAAKAAGSSLSARAFAFTSPAGRCETCKGSGRESVSMDILADLSLPCPSCDGRRYKPEVLAVTWRARPIDVVLELPVATLASLIGDDTSAPARALRDGLDRLCAVGLGHVSLGRRVSELSGGEAQRLQLAAALASTSTPALVCLDEPATGLHERDLERLRDVLATMTERGDLIIAAEHRSSLVASADWVIDLGPGGGPEGGQLVEAGPPSMLRNGATARALARYRP